VVALDHLPGEPLSVIQQHQIIWSRHAMPNKVYSTMPIRGAFLNAFSNLPKAILALLEEEPLGWGMLSDGPPSGNTL